MGDRKKDLTGVGDAEEIRDGFCAEDLFPLIGDSIIGTWNDVRIPPTKELLETELNSVGLLSAGFSKKRKRAKVTVIEKKRKKRKTNMQNMTNVHMVEDEEQRKKIEEANRQRKLRTGTEEKELKR